VISNSSSKTNAQIVEEATRKKEVYFSDHVAPEMMETTAATEKKIMRGFAGALRITVDKKNKLLSISNPIYMLGAFMQEEYDAALAEKTLATLRNSFKDLKNSDELIKFRVLESKKIVYEQRLENGAVVIGVKLGKRTSKFIKKTGYQNAGLLPYPVLIENGEAKILDPKYYISVMYPMLKMSQFMKIATVPGAISKDIDKIFRK